MARNVSDVAIVQGLITLPFSDKFQASPGWPRHLWFLAMTTLGSHINSKAIIAESWVRHVRISEADVVIQDFSMF